jgi:hypothetical protein
MMLWKLVRSVAAVGIGKRCRACGKPIFKPDWFGRSEEVCLPCRDSSPG